MSKYDAHCLRFQTKFGQAHLELPHPGRASEGVKFALDAMGRKRADQEIRTYLEEIPGINAFYLDSLTAERFPRLRQQWQSENPANRVYNLPSCFQHEGA